MRARSDLPLTVDEIAAATGLGRRALQLAFRQALDASPRAILTELRLERARVRLVRPAPALTVAKVTRASGFANPGRFATACRGPFGKSPTDMLHRAPGA